MQNYLGVQSVDDDEGQTQVTGTGDVFGDLGSFSLSYPFTNYSDTMIANGEGANAFDGNQGIAGVTKDGGDYHTAFFVFPIEAISSDADRQALIEAFLAWCGDLAPCLGDLDASGAVDVADLLQLLGAWGNAGGVEDLDGSGTVDVADLLLLLGAWGACP
jgi:hypothetical protein